jgi:cytosine/adenosine deaminase-related metal-dependent hydrolase
MSSLLLKNGTALIHDGDNHVIPIKTDILIKDTKIVQIGENIAVGSAEVVDCTDKIISPGFIDTHRHGWQTQLKGRHANELLMNYMATGNAQSFQYTAEDTFYGQLSGMLESIAAGTTTLVDHAHVTMSPAHAQLAISATASSGIRSVFCYCPILRAKSFNPLVYQQNLLEDWVMKTFEELADQANAGEFGDGRVTLGFAWDLWFLPPPVLQGIFGKVKAKGVKTITTHYVSNPQMGGGWDGGVPKMLSDLGLFDERFILSHSNGCDAEAVERIKKAGAHVSSTPSTELQMTMGRPVCFDASFLDGGASGKAVGAQDVASLGVDCHSNNAASIVGEARVGLQNARNNFNEHYAEKGKCTYELPVSLSVEAAFNLATIKGAEAIRMEKEVGRIAEGFKADLVIFDALSPAMLGAGQHDPVAAIILHSSPADIEEVIVDGVVRKKDGRLLPTVLDQVGREAIGRDGLVWTDVAKEVIRSRERIQKEIENIDFKEARSTLMKLFHVDESVYVNE